MSRRKRFPPTPKVIDEYYEGILHVEIVEIDEQTENFGKGASAKVRRLKNFDKALKAFAEEYYWGPKKRKLKKLVYDPRKTSALANELVTLGVELEDRAMRDLAVEIKRQIRVLDNVLQKNPQKVLYAANSIAQGS